MSRSRWYVGVVMTIAVATTAGAGVPGRAAVPGENGEILVVLQNSISRVDDTGTMAELQAGFFSGIDVAADGRSAVTVQLADNTELYGDVTMLDLDTDDSVSLQVSASSAVFSGADGRIVYADDTGLHALEDGGSRLIVAGENYEVHDGSSVDQRVLASRSGAPVNGFPSTYLEIVDVVTGDPTPVADNGPGFFTRYWTAGDFLPDGTDLAYVQVEPSYPSLIVRGATLEEGYTAGGSGVEDGVSFSPEGTSVAYGYYRGDDEGALGSVIRVRSVGSGAVNDIDVPDHDRGIIDVEWLPQQASTPPSEPTTPPTEPTPPDAGGGVTIALPNSAAENSDLSVQISQLTFPDQAVFAQPGDEVLVASETVFADALSSGTLQNTRGLLLTDPAALEDEVLAEIQRLGTTRVRILGGENAISPDVEASLVDAGLTVERTFGPSRLETAIAITRLSDFADSFAFLARAFPSSGATDPTQAFADSLALGGWAANGGVPILLSQTEVLSTSTATYLDTENLSSMQMIGGLAALSQAVRDGVVQRVETVSVKEGPTRFATAVGLATDRGFVPSARTNSIIVIEGQAENSWAAGFTVAALSGRTNAPIVLVNGDTVPAETEDYLRNYVTEDASVICIATDSACAAAQGMVGSG